MKEIAIYNIHNANLASIKSVEYNYSNKVFIFSLVKDLFTLTKGTLFIHARIHNYYLADSTVNKLSKMNGLITSGYKFSEISFIFNDKDLNNNLLDLLYEIWFAYEQVIFFV